MVYSVSDNNFWAQGSLSLSAAASATTLPSFSGQTSYRTVSRAGWTTNRYYNAPVGATNWFQSGPNVIDIATGFFNVLVPGVYSIHATVEFDMLLTDIARVSEEDFGHPSSPHNHSITRPPVQTHVRYMQSYCKFSSEALEESGSVVTNPSVC